MNIRQFVSFVISSVKVNRGLSKRRVLNDGQGRQDLTRSQRYINKHISLTHSLLLLILFMGTDTVISFINTLTLKITIVERYQILLTYFVRILFLFYLNSDHYK